MLKPSAVLACGILLLMCGVRSEIGTALADSTGPYQAPTYCEGDTWYYARGEKRIQMVHRVLRVADDLVEMDNRTIFGGCRECRVILDRNLAVRDLLRADGTSIPGAAGRKWWEFPLEVGKRWHFTVIADKDETGATRN